MALLGRTRVSGPRLDSAAYPFLAIALAVPACQPQDHAEFFDPSGHRRDGGQIVLDGGVDGGAPGGTVTGEAAGGRPKPMDFPMYGNPTAFDPDQVYLHGRFLGSEFANNAYGLPCADGVSAIADWSSPSDSWHTERHTTVALPCEVEDIRVRADGSILFEIAGKAIRAFSEEVPMIDGSNIVLPGPFPDGVNPDPEVWVCADVAGFRHWVHPVTGEWAASCRSPDLVYTHEFENGVSFDGLPSDFTVEHLGFENHMLLRSLDQPDRLQVWSPDASSDLDVPFQPPQVAAIRARKDGFILVVIENADPPTLTQWLVSYDGKATQGPDYPSSNFALDPFSCAPPLTGPPVPSTVGPEFNVDYSYSAGCVCALEPSGAALCIARDAEDVPVVLRFASGDQEAEVVFQVGKDDPFLIDIQGFVTGP